MDRHYYTEMAALEDEHWWFEGRRRILAEVLDTLNLRPHADVLEAGCGTGGCLNLLNRYGRLAAFEPDAGARRHANQRGIVQVVHGALPDSIPFEERRFDLAAMLDVLEHVEDDRAALVSLRGRLKPGGRLLLTVPAYAWLWSRHDEVNHHYRRYRLGPLTTLLEETGFVLDYATYFNTLLFPLIAGVRLFNKALGRHKGSDFNQPPPALNRLLAQFFAAERLVVPRSRFPFGVSLLAVARRPSE